MHRVFGQLVKFRRHLAFGLASIGLTMTGIFIFSDGNKPPELLAYSPESVETSKQLWMDVDATDHAATCYTDVLKEAGVLSEPIRTNADLADAHESMTEEQQQKFDDCQQPIETESSQNTDQSKYLDSHLEPANNQNPTK